MLSGIPGAGPGFGLATAFQIVAVFTSLIFQVMVPIVVSCFASVSIVDSLDELASDTPKRPEIKLYIHELGLSSHTDWRGVPLLTAILFYAALSFLLATILESGGPPRASRTLHASDGLRKEDQTKGFVHEGIHVKVEFKQVK